jgi:hypothetical protein
VSEEKLKQMEGTNSIVNGAIVTHKARMMLITIVLSIKEIRMEIVVIRNKEIIMNKYNNKVL